MVKVKELLLKERICSLSEQILSFKTSSNFGLFKKSSHFGLVMTRGDPQDRFFYPTYTLIMDLSFGLVSCLTSQSTAMVMSGQSVHLTTLFFPGQA